MAGGRLRRPRQKLVPSLLEKGGDKKQAVVVGACLATFSSSGCVGLTEALELAESGTKAANPLVQQCALQWLKAAATAVPAANLSKAAGGFKAAVLPLTDGADGN